MGAVAFVMASFLGISYLQVCIASLVPAIFYYIGLYVQVDAYAAKKGIKGLPKSELPSLFGALKEMAVFAAAVVVLFFLLAYLRRDYQAPFYTLLFLLAANMLRKKTRMNLSGFIGLLQNSGRLLAELAPIMAGIGFVLGSLMVTGVAQHMSSGIISMAGGNVVLLVILGGICSFILGMGLTVTACYVLLAILLAPALVQGGLNIVAVHFFIMYCGMLSYITPPVAIGAYAAASLAGTNAMKTGYTAMRLGLIIFLMPFFFVFNPAFILQAPFWEIVSVVGTGTVGVILICSAIEGYLLLFGTLSIVPRAITAVGGFLFLHPNIRYTLVGLVLMGILFVLDRIFQPGRREKMLGT
jgi:TRAP transporter 4TM/12TM fusion protein